ncbi:hypothetical protein BT93_E1536 [Corymbia citriodora subsp. variegata]|nr:hypothetical protein BT93_E1536 [Corymbia citriodora subsp. variegata]
MRMGRGTSIGTWACLILFVPVASSSHGHQPLARITVHEVVIALDGRASIKASPSILGVTGQNVEWVLLEYSSPNPSNDDWIGVFSPANFR